MEAKISVKKGKAHASNNIKTIVLFDQYSFLGGGQAVLLSITEAACRVAEQVVLAVPTGGALELAIRQRFGSRVEIVHTPELQLNHGRKGVFDIAKLIFHSIGMVIRHWWLVRRADLIHVNGARQFLGVIFLSVLSRKNCCYHVHIDHSNIEKRLIWLAASLTTTRCVIINSHFVMSRLLQEVKSLANNPKMICIENSLDRIYEGRNFIDRYAYCEKGSLNVVVLGVIRPEKGQDIAIELARRDGRIQVNLIGRIGDGAEKWVAQLQSTAPSNVTFHEPVLDVPAMFDRLGAHVNLVPSQWEEPFGLVAIEGMACSCITMVSNSGGLADIATKTSAVCCNDIEEMSMAIDRVFSYTSPEKTALAKKQFDAAMSLYRPERFVVDMCKVFFCHDSKC